MPARPQSLDVRSRCNASFAGRVHCTNFSFGGGSLEVMQSSPYCFATMVGGRQTLAPLSAEMSQTSPDSQSESCRHSSPYFRPYSGMHVPLTEMGESCGGEERSKQRRDGGET
uniref:Uncharacterized protein n=1 Tax=Anopheles culicifacies TaxID=139723 RepID=A0A182M1C8_9DIPT